jgi:integrase
MNLMASITRRPNGQWRARYRDNTGKEHARHFTRRVDAQRWLDTITTAVGTGSYVDPRRAKTTIGQVADQWLAGKINLKVSSRTRYSNALTVHVLPRWGAVPLDKVTHADVQAWIANLTASGLSGASVRKVTGVLSAVLDLAVKDKRLPSNPARGVNLPRANTARRRYLTATQVAQLADAAGPHRLVILTLAYTGLRWSELAALRVADVDLMRRRLNVTQAMVEIRGHLIWGTPKTHEHRAVPIGAILVDQLTRHIAGKHPDDLLFTTPTGRPLRNRDARRTWFDHAAEAIGEKGLTPHELRHTAASLAVSAGANVKAVQRMLGHASAAMTLDVYSDLFDDDLDAVANRLDQVLRASRETVARPSTVTRITRQA